MLGNTVMKENEIECCYEPLWFRRVWISRERRKKDRVLVDDWKGEFWMIKMMLLLLLILIPLNSPILTCDINVEFQIRWFFVLNWDFASVLWWLGVVRGRKRRLWNGWEERTVVLPWWWVVETCRWGWRN